MAKIKLGLQNMTILAKGEKGARIVAAMTGNPNFTTPNPPLADITAAKTALLTAYNDALSKRTQAKAATDLMADKEKDFERLLTLEALYVENASGGDELKIQSAEMSIRAVAVPVGQLPGPLALSAMAGNNDGEIDLNWEPVRGANSYVIQMTTDPNVLDSWAPKANATESYAVILGLTSGQKYWFRVAGIGAAGQGAFSGAESKYAP
ncbi:MAG: fibronectin type III domain-containing protein [Planctomycetota bacterium]